MEQFVNFVIRPPRAEYDPKTDLLDQEFMLKGKFYQRKDLELANIRGEVPKGSHYVPAVNGRGKPLPCVIFHHGNSGCRIDAGEVANVLLPSNITVFTLDFAGSGLSGGEHVTLGWNEVAKTCFVPVLIGHATDDDIIRPHHSDGIFEAYVGDKNTIKFEGDHNSPRPQFYFDSISIFFGNVLQPPEDELAGTFFHTTHDFLDKDVEIEDDCCASSARIIDSELLDGQPWGPHVPTSMDSDQSPECELHDSKGFPCNAEEEDMMSMQDGMEALRDREMHYPDKDEAHPGDSSTGVCKSSHAGDLESFIAANSCEALEREPSSTSLARARSSTTEIKHPSSETSMSLAFRIPSMDSSEEVPNASEASKKCSVPSYADSDMSIHMTAMTALVKDQASHIMDGLKCHWDLYFLRKSQMN